jgi:subtilisin family serine protease
MSRVSLRVVPAATLAALAFAACTDAPVQPDAAGPAPNVARAAQAPERVAPGEVILQLKAGATLDDVLRPHGASKKADGYKGAFVVARTAVGNERALAALLARDARVEFAEPNYIRTVDAIDSRLWAFYNPGGMNMSFYNDPDGRTGPIPSSYASLLDADEDAIEGIASGGSAVVVGSIDTGVDYGHPEFAGRLIRGCDWYSQSASGNSSGTCSDWTSDDTPEEGHGTHTTGTMAGASVGVAGVTGAASNVKVFVQRVCGEVGCYTSSIVNAIRAAADQPGLVAMNLSLGGNSESTAEKNAINYAVNTKGVLVIASAGNSGSGKVGCPACDPNAISVAATTWKDELASYSQKGSGLDISAPGGLCYSNTTEEGCIFSAVVAGYTEGRSYTGPLAGGNYAYMNGTSMAAPQVTGAAAAVASKLGLRGTALRSRLLSTADDKGAAGYDTKFGNGRLNVYRAVKGTSLGAGL